MEKCKNCKYFDSEQGSEGTDNGACTRLGMNQLIITDAIRKRHISFHNMQNPQVVFVGEDFGCVHFEKNEREKENG